MEFRHVVALFLIGCLIFLTGVFVSDYVRKEMQPKLGPDYGEITTKVKELAIVTIEIDGPDSVALEEEFNVTVTMATAGGIAIVAYPILALQLEPSRYSIVGGAEYDEFEYAGVPNLYTYSDVYQSGRYGDENWSYNWQNIPDGYGEDYKFILLNENVPWRMGRFIAYSEGSAQWTFDGLKAPQPGAYSFGAIINGMEINSTTGDIIVGYGWLSLAWGNIPRMGEYHPNPLTITHMVTVEDSSVNSTSLP
jgi:hypothetical protein